MNEEQDDLIQSEENDETEENPQVEQEENGELETEVPPNGAIVSGAKKLIEKYFKTKIIIISLTAIVVLILILLFTSLMDASQESYKYLKKQCKEVTIEYKLYSGEELNSQTVKMEDYVSSATYTYTKDFKNVGDIYHVYKSLAVAIRTEAVSHGCKVTYREELEKKPTSGENIEVLDRALEDVKGLVAVKPNTDTVISARVSSFCFRELENNNYTLYQIAKDYAQIPQSWVIDNITSDTLKNCVCNGNNQNMPSCYNSKGEWLNQDDTSGYSVYGAKYLLDKFGFNSETILKYFIGNYQLRSIYKNNGNGERDETREDCAEMDLTHSSLSKEEFVAGMQNYSGVSNDNWATFVKHAGDIYDVGQDKGLNPEFIVGRAIAEGFDTKGINNHWGWNCTNTGGGADCKPYSSDFKTAVGEYCDDVLIRYKSWDDLVMHYAYIGEYWYNPGGSGMGGCYYKNYAYPNGVPSAVEAACTSGKFCGEGGGPNCLKTTDDDQRAYGTWAQGKVLEFRKQIWGIDSNDCSLSENGAGCLWWPIGSSLTSSKSGKTFATGVPEPTVITSTFGYRGDLGIPGSTANHPAIDIAGGVEGQLNIIAAASGKVTEANSGCIAGNNFCGGGLGNYVKLEHSDGTITRYGHMYEIFVSIGDSVSQGQVIGKMGTTGASSGTHLDFQVVINGSPVNPLEYVSSTDPRTKCSGDGIVVSGGSNAQTVCKTLKNNGYSNDAVAAMMGNLNRESTGFLPSNQNPYGCDGISQWCGDRLVTLKSQYGSDWSKLENQLKFMMSELNTSHSFVKTYLNNSSNTLDEMTNYFCNNYHAPGASVCASSERRNDANGFLPYVRNGCK